MALISAGEAAGRLGVHVVTVGVLVRKGRLRAVKVANRWLIEEEELGRFAQGYTARRGRPRKRR